MKQIVEAIEKITDDLLVHVIRHSNEYTWNFFAMKVILTRLNMKMKMYNNDLSVLPDCCGELRNLLRKSANVPSSQADVKQILSLAQ